MNNFRLIRTSLNNDARAGELVTAHGTISTPVFLPVGSQATVKSLAPDDLSTIGTKILLANTYHLYLRPGIEIIQQSGGLHNFMHWDGAILTDSGGYQVFSLASLRHLNDEGVTFRSHIDGSQHFFTPELAIKYQEALGSDIIMALDEVPAHDETREKVELAMQRTHRWALRCQRAHIKNNQLLFAIVQGGLFSDLRRESTEYLKSLDFEGYAIGGLSLGETKELMYSIVEETSRLLPDDKPRYLMGVGSPEDIVESVSRGIDIFDCALPTRVARNGGLFTWNGRINIRNAIYKNLGDPIMNDCDCYTCQNFSAAYLHHLFNSGELLAYRLSTIHNLTFMQKLIDKIREVILNGNFPSFKEKFLQTYQVTDENARINQKQKWLKNRRSS